MGVPNLRDLNLCLIASWVQRYHDAEGRLWRVIIDHKYNNCSPNLFCCTPRNASPFLKCVLWAAKAAKLGFRWQLGSGRKIRFWEDLWFGTCFLAIPFWDIYSIVNEQGCTVRDVWDGVNLKFTFRRTVDRESMDL
jgi:hypothetical protein